MEIKTYNADIEIIPADKLEFVMEKSSNQKINYDVRINELIGTNMKVIARYGDVKIANSKLDMVQIEMKAGDLTLDTIDTKTSKLANNY
ncbi:MAG: DUF4097 family beta strand repeat-containing protein [Bacillaceae bacterium]